jgi:general secretion pathway protein A
MYESYFGLSEAPFSIAPDPRYLYMSQRHQEALAHLLYGVNGDGGFVLLTGEVGAGKTTVCRCLLEQIPESCNVAYIFNPRLTVEELLSTICSEFGIAVPDGNTSIKVFVDCINGYLLDAHAKGRHTVLVIDEAQNLAPEVLEQMRLLTNLETNRRKLLQIILLGQPELGDMLERPELKQLAQRVVARYHLGPLSKAEVAAYVRHRLEVAGAKRPLFPPSTMNRLFRLSRGIPRVVNVLCDRALLGAYVQGKDRIDRATIDQAAREIFHQPASYRRRMPNAIAAALILLVGGAAAAVVYQRSQHESNGADAQTQAIRPDTKAPAAIASGAATEKLSTALHWPDKLSRDDSKRLAESALLHAWGAEYGGGDICRQARILDLRCRTARGGLDDLRQANRPAVLHMHDPDGSDFYATLLQLNDRTASFSVGDETQAVPLSALAAQWSGEHTLLWRAPPEGMTSIRPGAHGPAVDWLGLQLAQLHGGTTEPNADHVYNDAMVNQVKQFQLAHGLTPDGAVGLQTQLRLIAAADPAAPKLAREPADK